MSNEQVILSQKTPRIGPCERESNAIDWFGLAGRIHRSVQIVRLDWLDWLPCYQVSSSECRADLVSKLSPSLSRRWSGTFAGKTNELCIDCRGCEYIRTKRANGRAGNPFAQLALPTRCCRSEAEARHGLARAISCMRLAASDNNGNP